MADRHMAVKTHFINKCYMSDVMYVLYGINHMNKSSYNITECKE